ncbi:MAG: endonuclease VIII [Eubacteriales bacterium]|nr:endonuclease VIII [Eubacteriales bacterium]
MIELPEALTLAKQIDEALVGKEVLRVLPPTKPHKFCWFNGEAADYEKQLTGSRIASAEGFGIYVEIGFDNGKRLCINDGVNPRLLCTAEAPKDHQLRIDFSDGTLLAFTVAMYGGIYLHDGDYDNDYYLKSRAYISPFSDAFEQTYYDALARCKPSLSAKAFIATEQRFPGIGNGVAQDILFASGVHPKRKVATMNDAERKKLLERIVSVLGEMTDGGGRDTEKDLFGNPGGYHTKMSKNALDDGCPACGGDIIKESYLGGSVYYCPHCQPLIK